MPNRHFTGRLHLVAMLALLVTLFTAAAAYAAPAGPQGTVHFAGPVQIKADPIVGTWRIAERDVVVTAETDFRPSASTISVGDLVAVMAKPGDGGLVARSIVKIEPPAPPQQVISGRIEALAANQWTIDGKVVLINANTKLEGDHPDVGDNAMAWAQKTTAGLLAKRILVKDALPPPPQVITGAIEALASDQWTIGGQVVLIDGDTKIDGDHPDVGDNAMAWAQSTTAGLLAKRIFVKDPEPAPMQVISGTIEALDAGQWTISGQVVLVDANTELDGDHPDVGDNAKAWVQDTTAGLLAKRILVKDPNPDPPGQQLVKGKIEVLAAGQWTIDGQEVLIDANTQLDGDHPDVGDYAMAWTEKTAAGQLARRILVKDPPPTPPGQSLVVFRGLLMSIDDAGVYTVQTDDGDKQVTTDDQTRIVGAPAAGDRVLVTGRKMDDGTILALMIVKLRDGDEHEQTPFAGFVTKVVSSTVPTAAATQWLWDITLPAYDKKPAQAWTIVVDENTQIDVDPNTVAVGAFIKGAGLKLDDTSIQAKLVRVTRPPQVRFDGEISAGPDASAPDFPQGVWTIGGTTVAVTAETRLIGEAPAVGKRAIGFGELAADGSVVARTLMVR